MGDTLIWLAEHIALISSLKKWMSPYPIRTEKGSHNVKWPSKGPEKEKSKSVNSLIQTLSLLSYSLRIICFDLFLYPQRDSSALAKESPATDTT